MPQEIVSEVPAIERHVELRMEIARTRVSQKDVAEKARISEGHLSHVLGGTRPLSGEVADRIATAIAELAS